MLSNFEWELGEVLAGLVLSFCFLRRKWPLFVICSLLLTLSFAAVCLRMSFLSTLGIWRGGSLLGYQALFSLFGSGLLRIVCWLIGLNR